MLLPFLNAPDEEAARSALGHLLQRDAGPLAWDVIRGQLRGVEKTDLEDVHGGVLLSLAAHLRALRLGGADEAPIRGFAGYVAAIAHNACHAFLRARYPQRARLRSRVRYVASRDPTLALWEGHGREWLCALASGRGAACHPGSVGRLAELSRRAGSFALSFPELVQALLRQLPGPARFDDLVDAIAAMQGISDQPARTGGPDAEREADPLRDLADPAPSQETALADRDFLARLWTEIRLLPSRQRAALLLNLRDAEGRGMIGLFPLTETAALSELAEALEMDEERLRALWDDLPRDDAWIAECLGVTRRQVINLRKCARERLTRRLRREAW